MLFIRLFEKRDVLWELLWQAGSVLRVSALSVKVFIRSLSNLVDVLVGIISRTSFITCQIPQALLNYGP